MKKKAVKRVFIFTTVALFIIFSAVIAIKKLEVSEENPFVNRNPTPSTQWVELKINNNSQWIDLYSNEQWYDTPTLNLEYETEVTIGNFTGYEISINDKKINSGGKLNFSLNNLSVEKDVTIQITDINNGQKRYHHIRTLPSNYYVSTVLKQQNVTSGFYYFNMNDYIYKMNTEGQIVFFKYVPGGFDFKPTLIEDKLYYSYLQKHGTESSPFLIGVDYYQAKAMVLNEQYDIIDEVTTLFPSDEKRMPQPLSNSQFTILGDKHYLISSFVGKRVKNIPKEVLVDPFGSRVVAVVLQEVMDGKVIWQWDSTHYPELYKYSMDADFNNLKDYWADYAHLNSLAIDTNDNNLIASFGKINALIKIDRTNGNIIWILGGRGDQFALSDDQELSNQHDIRIDSTGVITFLNNGPFSKSGKDKPTHVVEIKIDESAKKIVSYKLFNLDHGFVRTMGGTQKLDEGVYVIGWGDREGKLPLFSEIDFNTNNVLFELLRPNLGPGDSSYKVYKFNR